MTKEEIKSKVAAAVEKARADNPLVPSITNTVTANFVANAQLTVGGSAVMVYMLDEVKSMVDSCDAFYINLGTMLPVLEEASTAAAKLLCAKGKPWVLDPVGIGMGESRSKCLKEFKACKPSIIRGNASEIIGLANLWGVSSDSSSAGPRGVDSVDTVDSARKAAIDLAVFTGGAVSVSGDVDLVTDGKHVVLAYGGSKHMGKLSGTGCSLGGVCGVYAAVADPFIAALSASMIYNLAGSVAEKLAKGPANFQMEFMDNMYMANGNMVSSSRFEVKEL